MGAKQPLPVEEAMKIQKALEPLGYEVLGYREKPGCEVILYLSSVGRFNLQAPKDPDPLVSVQ